MGKEMSEKTRGGRVLSHLKHNVVGYVALLIAVSMTPLPSYAAGLIGTADIKDGAVTTAKLHANAVKSGKITDGQVKKVDIAAGARGYTSILPVKETFESLGVGAIHTFNVACGPGRVAVGGGGYVHPTGAFNFGGSSGTVLRSIPVDFADPIWWPASTGMAADGWRTTVENTTGEIKNAFGYALCAKK
jgi:hypothetical protein